jgi:hypothetical protein
MADMDGLAQDRVRVELILVPVAQQVKELRTAKIRHPLLTIIRSGILMQRGITRLKQRRMRGGKRDDRSRCSVSVRFWRLRGAGVLY